MQDVGPERSAQLRSLVFQMIACAVVCVIVGMSTAVAKIQLVICTFKYSCFELAPSSFRHRAPFTNPIACDGHIFVLFVSFLEFLYIKLVIAIVSN